MRHALRDVRLQARVRHADPVHDGRSVGVLLRYPQGRALLRSDLLGEPQSLPHGARQPFRPDRAAWLAPMLCFTAEEAWLARYPSEDGSVHLAVCPEMPVAWADDALAEKWRKVRASTPRRHRRDRDRARRQSASALRSRRRRSSMCRTRDLLAALERHRPRRDRDHVGRDVVAGDGPSAPSASTT